MLVDHAQSPPFRCQDTVTSLSDPSGQVGAGLVWLPDLLDKQVDGAGSSSRSRHDSDLEATSGIILGLITYMPARRAGLASEKSPGG